MKWFKHISKSRYDAKIMRLIRKHGLRGYGLYFAILEGIAFDLEPDKPIPELEETAHDIANFFGDDTLKVQEIVDDCVKEGLFEVHPETKRIMCLKLLAYLDNTMAQNPQIKSILSNFKSLEADSLKQIRLDEIRLDQTREKREEPLKETLSEKIQPSTSFERLFKIYEKRWGMFFPTYHRERSIAILDRVQPTDDELIAIIDAVSKPEWVLERINALENKKRKAQSATQESTLRRELSALKKAMDACTVEAEWHTMDKRYQEIRNELFRMGLKA